MKCMVLTSVLGFLQSIPNEMSTDGTNIRVRCPFCGDSIKNPNSKHFSIKAVVDEDEPMLYHCFQPSYRCGAQGILTPDVLQKLGCMDMKTLMELSQYNMRLPKHIRGNKNQLFKVARQYEIVNRINAINQKKMDYINHRLGITLDQPMMRQLKIQLSINDYLKLNDIQKRTMSQKTIDVLNRCTIGFVSAYSDYLILRDVTADQITGRRYTMYRNDGTMDPNDMKLYVIPTELDLLSPEPLDLHIAEGTFSILGAYLNCKQGRDHRNQIFAANCGTGYFKTIDHIAKQYGMLSMCIHIWSDSEVPVKTYKKLLETVDSRIDIRSFTVYYNSKAEDFGHAKSDIKVERMYLK